MSDNNLYSNTGNTSNPNTPPKAPFNLFGITWEKNYVQVAPAATQKNTILAYVLWFFLGALGVHQYYLGNIKRGLIFLALTLISAITAGIGIGFVFGLAYFAYWIYDAVVLQEQVNEANSGRIRQSVL
jgi:TM2 domain-containing membrane protein YozV